MAGGAKPETITLRMVQTAQARANGLADGREHGLEHGKVRYEVTARYRLGTVRCTPRREVEEEEGVAARGWVDPLDDPKMLRGHPEELACHVERQGKCVEEEAQMASPKAGGGGSHVESTGVRVRRKRKWRHGKCGEAPRIAYGTCTHCMSPACTGR